MGAGGGAWCFRIRFDLGRTVRIEDDATSWVLSGPDEQPVVRLKSRTAGEPLRDARHLTVNGCGYPSQAAAREAADRWEGRVQLGFAANGLGADFGYRARTGGFTTAGLGWAQEQLGVERALNDVHGVMTYLADPAPRFVAMSADGVVGKQPAQLRAALELARTRDLRPTRTAALAFDLWSASFFQPSADARFLLLMAALESLIEPAPRTGAVAAHVAELIRSTEQSALPADQRDSLLGSLRALENESIGQAGRRLAGRLGKRRYDGLRPVPFFTACYRHRSLLVHGAAPLPSRETIDRLASNLETFVGHLIGIALLDGLEESNAVSGSRADPQADPDADPKPSPRPDLDSDPA